MTTTFPEALSSILKTRKMSTSVAAAELGYSSKTALIRILNGESKPSSYQKCMDAILASPAFILTHEEKAYLERALLISTLGKMTVILNNMLYRLMHPIKIDDSPAMQPVSGVKGFSKMEDVFSHISSLHDIEIIIFGKCSPEMLRRFASLSHSSDVHSIHHIIAVYPDNPKDYLTVGDTSDILFCPVYSLYTFTQTKDVNEWSFRTGIIFISGVNSHGSRKTLMLTPMQKGDYYCVNEPGDGILRMKDRILEDSKGLIHPIKATRSYMKDPFPLNYMAFIDEYKRIEYNREIYLIKPDIPFFSISPDLLYPIIVEAFKSISPVSENDPVITSLYQIQKSRYDNLFNKKKVTHFVLSREAMEDFARTGKREDHFFLIRPYTPQERVSILTTLLVHMLNCPYFHIWFSRNPDLIIDKEITGYENYALAIVNPDTDWNISDNHQEILLQSKNLSSAFRDYYMDVILKDDVCSREESIAILRELIEIAKAAE